MEKDLKIVRLYLLGVLLVAVTSLTLGVTTLIMMLV